MAATPTGKGYWLCASDGGIFAYGDAKFYGSTGAIHLNKPIVAMSSTPTGTGYWLCASDGGIFAYGDAKFYGSTGAIHLNKPIVAMAATKTRQGLLALRERRRDLQLRRRQVPRRDHEDHREPCADSRRSASGNGYWMAAVDGTVAAFGDASVLGSVSDFTSVLVA